MLFQEVIIIILIIHQFSYILTECLIETTLASTQKKKNTQNYNGLNVAIREQKDLIQTTLPIYFKYHNLIPTKNLLDTTTAISTILLTTIVAITSYIISIPISTRVNIIATSTVLSVATTTEISLIALTKETTTALASTSTIFPKPTFTVSITTKKLQQQ